MLSRCLSVFNNLMSEVGVRLMLFVELSTIAV